jgi:hypothetical protein
LLRLFKRTLLTLFLTNTSSRYVFNPQFDSQFDSQNNPRIDSQNDPQNDPQNNPQNDSLGSIFQDYSGKSLNLIFSLIFAISNLNLTNKPSTLPLSNYFLPLSESIIKKTLSNHRPRRSQDIAIGLL